MWANDKKLVRAKIKSLLVFRTEIMDDKNFHTYINNNPLEQVISMKYFGVIIDAKFVPRTHV